MSHEHGPELRVLEDTVVFCPLFTVPLKILAKKGSGCKSEWSGLAQFPKTDLHVGVEREIKKLPSKVREANESIIFRQQNRRCRTVSFRDEPEFNTKGGIVR